MEDNKDPILTQEPNTEEAEEKTIPAGGISFGGGADNEYIKAFASKPKYNRTLEEIELDEKKGAGTVNEDVRARVRAEAKRHKEEFEAQQAAILSQTKAAAAPESAPAPETAEEDAYARYQRLMQASDTAADTPTLRTAAAVPSGGRISLIDPLEEETEYTDEIGEDTLDEEEIVPEGPQIPESKFRRLFSASKGFSVFTLIAAIFNILWDILYVVAGIIRSVMMSSTERTLQLQGQTSYTLIFESPMLSILKVFMYLLPILAVVWTILFKKTDSKGTYYNRKIVIVFVCLIALTMLFTVIDLTSMHLLA